jgi:hypothetical protein
MTDIYATRIYHGEWIALDADTYYDSDETRLSGIGSTEQEAIDDLLAQMEEQNNKDVNILYTKSP